MATKLDKIDEFLRGLGGQQKCYVDTGPILERDYAAAAGMAGMARHEDADRSTLGSGFLSAKF